MKESLAYNTPDAWLNCHDGPHEDALRELCRRYMSFISACKTERETVEHIVARLREMGFSENFHKDNSLVMRPLRGKALFAARRGRLLPDEGVLLIASHVDAPRLDFKQRPLVEQAGVAQAKTHYYGGIRKYQWLARPLALHGVIVREDGARVPVCIGENADDPVFCIADLLPHLAQKQNGHSITDAFDGEKLNVILGHRTAGAKQADDDKSGQPENGIRQLVLEILHQKYGIREEDLISSEIEAVPAGPARYVGLDRALIGAYGQDDRICAFTALEAFLEAEKNHFCQVLIFWDKEEIGSDGATGASSAFLRYCLEDLLRAWGAGGAVGDMFLRSRAISADVQAALDPDFQDLHEKQNAARLGAGPCFSKFTGSRGKYGASEADAEFFAALRGQLNSAGIPWQAAELGKVDTGGGGTVALFLAALGMSVIDLGPALLSMHSPFELSSCADLYATLQAYKAFLCSSSAHFAEK